MQSLIQNIKTTILRKDILEHLERGLREHRAEYAEATLGFKEKYLEASTRVQKLAKKGEFPDVAANFGLVRPRDITNEYEDLLAAFDALQDEKLEMTLSEVSTIVNNKWDFTYQAKLQNSMYSASAANSLRGW